MSQPKKNPDLNVAIYKAREEAQKQTEPPPVRHRRAALVEIYVVVAAIGFAILSTFAVTSHYFVFDLSFTREMQEFTPHWFQLLMVAISWFGYGPQVVIIALILVALLYVFGYRWEAVCTFIAALLAILVDTLVKDLVARPRPSANLITVFGHVLKSYSFPSGHVTYFLAFFGFLWFLSFTLLKPSVPRTILLIIFGILILLVGPSRIYLGDHWSSDVLGGYLLGSLVLISSIAIYRWGKTRFFVTQEVAPPGEKA